MNTNKKKTKPARRKTGKTTHTRRRIRRIMPKKATNKIVKAVTKLDRDIKNLSLTQNAHTPSHTRANGSFRDCLMDPRSYLARVPQSTSKTIVAKIVRNFTLTANMAGNICFVFVPHAICDTSLVNSATSPFWYQNHSNYTPTNAETTNGYIGFSVGSIINAAFTSARAISASIELTPNVSVTSAMGRGIIAMTKVITQPARMAPGDTSAAAYSQLQLQDTMLSCPYVNTCEVSKMQGLLANWLPHEAVDLLDYPPINFNNSGDLAKYHPNENFVIGLFTGLPSSCSINVRTYTNIELIPNSAISTAGLFPLIAEFSSERQQPILALRDVYVSTNNFCHPLYLA